MKRNETPDTIPEQPKKKKRTTFVIHFDPPSVKSITDIIAMGNSGKLYKNINTLMLARVTPVLEELNNLIGLESVKQTIFFQVLYYLQNMHSRNQNEEYLHTVIMGPPGTGKTTIAKIIGKIYQEMSILSRNGIFKIAYRDDLIAGYLGQTALKTRKLLDSCIGGVLFIDEVYSLGNREGKDSFSKEAIDTITGFLSEHKNDCCVIIAGYEKEIEDCFFQVNRGLKRRFPWSHTIIPYTSIDLSKIMVKMIHDIHWNISYDNLELIKFFDTYKEHFKNSAGDIETLITKAKMCHSHRVFSLDEDNKFVIIMEDITNAIKIIIENNKKDKDEPPFGMYS